MRTICSSCPCSSQAPIRQNSRSAFVSTYSLSRAVAIPQSVEEGAGFAGGSLALSVSFRASGAVILAAARSGSLLRRFEAGLRKRAPWLLVLGLFLTLWEVATAKFAWLP